MKARLQAVALAGALALAPAGAAMAQAGAETIEGTVVSLSGGDALVRSKDGQSHKVRITGKTQYMTSTPVDLEAIKPGSYVGTANVDQADGSGVSQEVHIFEGPSPGQGLNAPWGGGAMMTNGNVAKVAQGPDGARLEIDYGKGSKAVLAPKGAPIVVLAPTTDAALVKAGSVVKLRGGRQADGSIEAGYMTVQVEPR